MALGLRGNQRDRRYVSQVQGQRHLRRFGRTRMTKFVGARVLRIGRPAVPPREHKLTQALESKLPPRHSASVGVRYAVAVLSVVAALSVTKVLRVYFEQTPNALFFCSVLLSSWFGGLGPGLLASLLSVDAIDYFFLFPRYTLAINPEDIPRLAVFLLSAFCISWVSERQRRAEKSLYQARDELEMKVYERSAELAIE
jgi:K+-sensing histidine kinase KdpD